MTDNKNLLNKKVGLPYLDFLVPTQYHVESIHNHVLQLAPHQVHHTNVEPMNLKIGTTHPSYNKKKHHTIIINRQSKLNSYLFLGMLNQYSGLSLFLP